MRCFIAGTDTGVGKTFFTAALLRSWTAAGFPAIGFKPISTGSREDAALLQKAVRDPLPLDEINPCHLQTPVSPWIAAKMEQKVISIPAITKQITQSLRPFSHVAIEGTGGWLTPLSPHETMADVAVALGFPVLIVTRPNLGTLNHTLLTIQSIRSCGLPILGLVINHHGCLEDESTESNPSSLSELTGLPHLNFQSRLWTPALLPPWLKQS